MKRKRGVGAHKVGLQRLRGYIDSRLNRRPLAVRGFARRGGTDLAVELLESPLFQTGAAVNDRLRRPPRGGAPLRARH